MEPRSSVYEPPLIRTVGSVYEFTQTQGGENGHGRWCFFDKRLGEPDFWACIPVANCS